MLVFEPFVVVRLAAPFTIPQKISIAERKGVTSLDSLKASVKVPWSRPRLAIKLIGNLERRRNKEGRRQAYRGVGDFGAVGNKRAAGKKEGRGPVRRPVGKKEGRVQAYRAVGHLRPASNERAAINTEARIQLEARTKAR